MASVADDKGLGDGIHFTFGDLAYVALTRAPGHNRQLTALLASMFEAVNCITTHLKISIIRPYPSLKVRLAVPCSLLPLLCPRLYLSYMC